MLPVKEMVVAKAQKQGVNIAKIQARAGREKSEEVDKGHFLNLCENNEKLKSQKSA